jgi:hypothetical protein
MVEFIVSEQQQAMLVVTTIWRQLPSRRESNGSAIRF